MNEKHRANAELVEFAKNFTGLQTDIASLVGKEIISVIDIPTTNSKILIFSDKSFIIHNALQIAPKDIILGLNELLSCNMELPYTQDFMRYQELLQKDYELTKMARTENILGAITNNIKQIPELHSLIPELLSELEKSEKKTVDYKIYSDKYL